MDKKQFFWLFGSSYPFLKYLRTLLCNFRATIFRDDVTLPAPQNVWTDTILIFYLVTTMRVGMPVISYFFFRS